jgi:hypothetical protein
MRMTGHAIVFLRVSVGTVESAELYFLNILSIVVLYYSVIRANNTADVELDLRAD